MKKKPHTTIAMKTVIQEATEKIPFGMSFDGFCVGQCDVCPEKLLEYLDGQISDWKTKLDLGEVPNLGDVRVLAESCHQVYDELIYQGLIDKPVNS